MYAQPSDVALEVGCSEGEHGGIGIKGFAVMFQSCPWRRQAVYTFLLLTSHVAAVLQPAGTYLPPWFAGVTTDILHRRCQWVLGVDKSLELVQVARQKYPHCRLEAMDGFDWESLQAASPSGTYDKIWIDIGGIAQLHVVMSLLGLYYRTFRGAYIIVKSKYLKNMLGNMQVSLFGQGWG
jgi:hypothetical protein